MFIVKVFPALQIVFVTIPLQGLNIAKIVFAGVGRQPALCLEVTNKSDNPVGIFAVHRVSPRSQFAFRPGLVAL